MNRRMKLKTKKENARLNLFLVIFILVSLSVWVVIKFVDKKVTPVIMDYAVLETEKLVTLVLNTSVSKVTDNNLSIEKLFTMVKNNAGEINSIDFNPIAVNQALSGIGDAIQQNLKRIEEGNIDLLELPKNTLSDYDNSKLKKGVIYEIPIGAITGMSLLSNLGPKIPVKFKLVGSVVTNVNTKVKAYGINNALIEVTVHLAVSMQVNLPFRTKKVMIENDIPVAIKIVQGTVPKYFQNGINENSGILTIPIE